MRTTPILSLAAVLAVACGGSGSAALKDQAREAMPGKDTVITSAPGSAAPGLAPAGPQGDVVTLGSPSIFQKATVDVAATFNLSAVFALGLVEAITAQEPTRCDSSSCTWGPGHGAFDYNNFEMVVTRDGANFKYALSGEPLSKPGSGFIAFLTGSATPSATPHHGSGNFTVDFDAAARLDHPGTDTGKLAVTYTNIGPANIQVTFPDATDKNSGNKENIAYGFVADASGGGDLDFAVHNLTKDERFAVHSRWKSSGQGRADVKYTPGTNAAAQLSECWGIAPFNVVYFQSNVAAYFGPDVGIESSCAFSPAVYSTKTPQ